MSTSTRLLWREVYRIAASAPEDCAPLDVDVRPLQDLLDPDPYRVHIHRRDTGEPLAVVARLGMAPRDRGYRRSYPWSRSALEVLDVRVPGRSTRDTPSRIVRSTAEMLSALAPLVHVHSTTDQEDHS